MGHKAEQQQEEAALFNAFIAAHPNFAGEPLTDWIAPTNDPPDVLCHTTNRRVGVEMGEWLSFPEMTAAKGRERTERALEFALDPQPVNVSKYFEMVIYHPKQKGRLLKSDSASFRAAVLDLIYHVDQRWPSEPYWRGRQSVSVRDFAQFPILRKYLEYVEFRPGDNVFASGIPWILPPCRGGWYDVRTMLDPLLGLIRAKVDKYQGQSPQTLRTPCDEFVLVIPYNQALLYCSPIHSPNFGLEQIAETAAVEFRRRPGPFSKAFLFIATEPGQRVFQLA
jgi:hypothetical protein